jgi:hypothetical protein
MREQDEELYMKVRRYEGRVRLSRLCDLALFVDSMKIHLIGFDYNIVRATNVPTTGKLAIELFLRNCTSVGPFNHQVLRTSNSPCGVLARGLLKILSLE